jgi:hypothetical protein
MTDLDHRTLILNSAAEYAVLGLFMLPLARMGKRPLINDWTSRATVDPAVITGWLDQYPEMNLGILCGATSGIVVIDVDPRNHGDEHIDQVLLDKKLEPPVAYVRTGSGGRHFYFKHPGGFIKSRTGKDGLAPGVELKADGGHLVVAPPSTHSNGNQYKWEFAEGSDWTELLTSFKAKV